MQKKKKMQSESSPVHSIISRWKEKEGENESKRRSSNAHEGFRPGTPTLNEKKTTFGISSLRPKKRIVIGLFLTIFFKKKSFLYKFLLFFFFFK